MDIKPGDLLAVQPFAPYTHYIISTGKRGYYISNEVPFVVLEVISFNGNFLAELKVLTSCGIKGNVLFQVEHLKKIYTHEYEH